MSLNDAVNEALPSALADLKRLIAIRSISSQPEHADDVLATADLVVDLLKGLGCPEVRFMEAGGGNPAVFGHFPAPEGQPTVLLYAHYDVQPTGDPGQWTSPAFAAVERDGRLYARGSADDKGGIAVHLGALRAFNGKPPVGVKIFIEGEEEIGSPSMSALLSRFGADLASDVFVIADAVNWKVGEPALTSTLRGLVDAVVTVSTLETGLHSGQFGGVVPDALTALCRLLATLHDERGNVAIEGLLSAPDPDVEYDEDRLREETGILDGVEWIGEGMASARMWTKPSASVLAIDATPVKDASNTLVPTARAKVSVRIAPGDDVASAAAALKAHLLKNAPWGAKVTVEAGQGGAGTLIDLSGDKAEAAMDAFREAFGVDAVKIGTGGSIPIVAEFAELNPDAVFLLTAVVDPTSRMHGIDESLDLGDLAKATLAEALLLQNLSRKG
ncbi:Acetylornithine deacetylase/Succinyl-diaminopimelate desuccinylase [Tessaracoccus bendigoensis DSM 12906]|uniref:Acetylornithine deacetylase/Succinyl-diaminopimelate desuccinylase n=1 Tax=Tessaracoccus bendigoensis DSM 12906 TaxID=1123357 RepID=A0A1M6IHY9_9ACTN|nr:dipeptidase [Tessaracoccus bendigoensis]SHJ34006.1 Acetylornithine deacetylase/Succinyl-diaminopimelate desuccinylase [Tessaracoccus bendigoensis DSM 12906]